MTGKRKLRNAVKALIAFCAVAAMLAVFTVAASPAHVHTKSLGSQCDLCFAAHTVSAEEAANLRLVQRPDEHEYLLTPILVTGYRYVARISSSDRGPPSL